MQPGARFLRRRLCVPVTNIGARHTLAAEGVGSSHVLALRERFEMGQGGVVRVDVPSRKVDVHVLPMWAEHAEVEVFASESAAAPSVTLDGLELRVLENCATPAGAAAEAPMLVRVLVPQICDVVVTTGGGNVQVTDKLEGSLSVFSGAGSIDVNKVQGEVVRLDACGDGGLGGRIDVRKVIEGEIALRASVVECRRLQGPSIEIVAPPGAGAGGSRVAVSSLYAGDVHIESAGGVELGSAQGALEVASDGDVRIDSLTGSIRAVCGGASLSVHVDVLAGECDVRSTGGDAAVSLASPLDAAVEVRGRRVDFDRWDDLATPAPTTAGADAPAPSSPPRRPAAGEDGVESFAGRLVVASDAASSGVPASFSSKKQKSGSGKISRAGQQRAAAVAAAAATRSGRAEDGREEAGAFATANGAQSGGGSDDDDDAASGSGSMVRVTAEAGVAQLGVLSWMEMMRRKLNGLR